MNEIINWFNLSRRKPGIYISKILKTDPPSPLLEFFPKSVMRQRCNNKILIAMKNWNMKVKCDVSYKKQT